MPNKRTDKSGFETEYGVPPEPPKVQEAGLRYEVCKRCCGVGHLLMLDGSKMDCPRCSGNGRILTD